MGLKELGEITKCMRENHILELSFNDTSLKITKESIIEHHKNKYYDEHKEEIDLARKKAKEKLKETENELKNFCYGKNEMSTLDKKEIGELYGAL